MSSSDLTVFAFGPCWGLPSFDARCLAVHATLRLAGVAHTLDASADEAASPTRTLPFVRVGDTCATYREWRSRMAQCVGDLDAALSGAQRVEAAALLALIETRLHDAMLHCLWACDANFDSVTRRVYADALPFPLGYLVRTRRRRQVLDYLASVELVDARVAARDAIAVCDALSLRLGASAFFFGARPSALDGAAFGFLAVALHAPLPDSTLRDAVQAHANLVAFVRRVQRDCFDAHVPLLPPAPVRSQQHMQFAAWDVPIPVPQFAPLTRAEYAKRRADFLFVTGGIFVCGLFWLTSRLSRSD